MTTPKITPAIITEYLSKEEDPRWYFGLVGDLAASEPFLNAWVSDKSVEGITRGDLNLPAPIAVMLQAAMRQMFIRGMYFGKRYELSNWEPDTVETPFSNKITKTLPKPRVEGDADAYGEEDQLTDKDFL